MGVPFLQSLALRDTAKEQLQQIRDIETGINYLNKVKAIEVWAKAEKKDAELQNMIAEQKVRTQRILGNLLIENGTSNNRAKGNQHTGKVENTDQTKLSEYGISKSESSDFQKIASIPEKIFEREIERAKEESTQRIELTTSRLLRAADKLEKFKGKSPYRLRVSTYLQGTILNLFKHHLNIKTTEEDGKLIREYDVRASEYLRDLIIKDLRQRYEIHPVKGIIKVAKSK